ncbi:si:dkey-100n23.5 isoform X2 [Gadus macrocephalus]|nr:si:dkey-100n23.5 isoform X2 [Gadus macrocephalus]
MCGDFNGEASNGHLLISWMKMILSLTVAAFFDSAAYVMGESHPEGFLCAFQGLWLTYFDWCALAWVCLITFNLYLNLVREISTSRYET